MFHPCYGGTVEFFLYGDMAHGRSCCSAMPVLFVWFEINHIAGMYFFLCTAIALHPAAARRYDQRLAERMGMPGGARTRLKSNQCHSHAGRFGRTVKRVYPYRPGKI